jgi:NADPH:quinone reductase-like Zn-dependent oxidoreductase
MRAVIQERYGSVDDLAVREVAAPKVADDEVLVRVRAASVHPDVWHVIMGRPYVLRLMGAGVRQPRDHIPGTDMSGHVESVGKNVTHVRTGDEVFGETLRGVQWRHGGAYAEYVAVPGQNLALKPDNLTFEQAACIPTAGLIALHNLPTRERLKPGHRVLVNGAGGGVGSVAVQLAKAAGATVTGIDQASKFEMIRSLGGDHVIDFREEDFTRAGERYDVLFDIHGNHPFSQCRRALTSDGTYVLIGHDGFGDTAGRWLGSMPRVIGLTVRSPFVRQLSPAQFAMPPKSDSMSMLRGLIDSGQLTAVVDSTYSLSEVPAAIHHLERGTACGRIVITL